jgi:hypothetical protein
VHAHHACTAADPLLNAERVQRNQVQVRVADRAVQERVDPSCIPTRALVLAPWR